MAAMKMITLLLMIAVGTQSLPLNSEAGTKNSQCGIRSLGVPLNNATQDSNFNVEYFRTQGEAFPWIVKLVLSDNSENLLLCTGVAVSRFVAIFPAHCVSGNQKSRLNVVQNHEEFPVENIILHPDFVFKHASHQHDISVVKIRHHRGFDEARVACLPEFDEDPVDECQIVNYFPDAKDATKVS